MGVLSICQSGTWREPYSFYDLLTADGGSTGITWYFTCSQHPAGTTWTTGNETDATTGGGVNLGSLSVSAQAGYSKSVQLTFTFNHSGEVCGNNSQGPTASSLVEADTY
jgi:hypothetical protein